jgi:hypothetical protein
VRQHEGAAELQDLLISLLIHPSLAERPDLVLVVAGVFVAVGALALLGRIRRTPIQLRPWPCFAVAVPWVLYALWEAEMQGKGYDMRVDLLLLHPFITIASALALVSTVWRPRRPENAEVSDSSESV